MRPNGSTKRSAAADPDQEQVGRIFSRMSRSISQLAKEPKAADVHHFRTNSRRVEALLVELLPETGNKKKLIKLLAKLRKKAGKVRDLDVEISFLKDLRVPDRQNHRARLLESLSEEHSRRAKKLVKRFDDATVRELRKRLERARAQVKLDGIEPLKLALSRLPKPGQPPITEKTLHSYRIATKNSRYLAELATASSNAKALVEELKHAQDEVGEWHDLVKLQERAERLFGSVHDSALVAALQNISRARFRRAMQTMATTLSAAASRQPETSSPLMPRKVTETAPAAESAA